MIDQRAPSRDAPSLHTHVQQLFVTAGWRQLRGLKWHTRLFTLGTQMGTHTLYYSKQYLCSIDHSHLNAKTADKAQWLATYQPNRWALKDL